MAENENMNPVEAHEQNLRTEFVEASQNLEDTAFLEELRRKFDESQEKERRATELATSNYEMDATKVETDRMNNLGATAFTSEGASEPIADNPDTKGGGRGATSAATATPSVVARSSSAPAASPDRFSSSVKPESEPTTESE